jgi:hypothetical protein
MDMQVRLANGIKHAEAHKSGEMDERKHVLRLLGDALAWKILDRHSLRELSRDRLRPAHLSSQGKDFDFVLQVAENSAKRGDFPLICDLTNLLAVGDLLVVGSSGLTIFECKNRTVPMRVPSGRLARQEERAREAAEYLESGLLKTGTRNQLAIDIDEPPYEYAALRDCVEQSYANPPDGAGLVKLGERDFILALRPGQRKVKELLGPLSNELDAKEWRLTYAQGFSGAIWYPSPFRSNPFLLPLTIQQRCDLVHGDLIVSRVVDIAKFEYSGEVDGLHIEFSVALKGGELNFQARVDGESVELSNRFIEQVFWDFKNLAKMRAMVAEMVAKWTVASRALQDEGVHASEYASPTVKTSHGFVFRSQGEDDNPLVRVSVEELRRLGVDTSALTDDLFVSVEGSPNMAVAPMIVEFQNGRSTIRPAADGGLDADIVARTLGTQFLTGPTPALEDGETGA